MKILIVLVLALQVAPVFSGNLKHAGFEDVCVKFGCTLPPIETIFFPAQPGASRGGMLR